jgi:hypothetical protein
MSSGTGTAHRRDAWDRQDELRNLPAVAGGNDPGEPIEVENSPPSA